MHCGRPPEAHNVLRLVILDISTGRVPLSWLIMTDLRNRRRKAPKSVSETGTGGRRGCEQLISGTYKTVSLVKFPIVLGIVPLSVLEYMYLSERLGGCQFQQLQLERCASSSCARFLKDFSLSTRRSCRRKNVILYAQCLEF